MSPINSELLEKILNDDKLPLSAKSFWISQHSSFLLFNNTDRQPSDFERQEALIFAVFWTFRLMILHKYPIDKNFASSLFCFLFTDENREESLMDQYFEFYSCRFDFYLKETSLMRNKGYNFTPILCKLYIQPLSPLNSDPCLIDQMTYLELLPVFTIGLKHYEELVLKILQIINPYYK